MSSDAMVLDVFGNVYDEQYERRNQEIMDDIQTDYEYWVSQQELREEKEMLNDVDRVTCLIKVESSDDENDYEWSGMYDEDQDEGYETILTKSVPRYSRPTKRQLHPVNHRCFSLRYRRDEVNWTNESLQAMCRNDDAKDLAQELNFGPQLLKSVHSSLPKDIELELYGDNRNYSVRFMSDGRIVYTFESDPTPPLFQRDDHFRSPRHLYNYHPAAHTSVRRPGR